MIETDEVRFRPMRLSDSEWFAEVMADWPGKIVDGKPVPNTPIVCEVECRRWVSIHAREVGRAWVVENLDAAAGCAVSDRIGVVLWRQLGDVVSDLIVALHPSHRSSAGRCRGHYRAIDSLLHSHWIGSGRVSRASWAILPGAAAVHAYAAQHGWRANGERVGETGQTLAEVEVDASIYATAAARNARLAKSVTSTPNPAHTPEAR